MKINGIAPSNMIQAYNDSKKKITKGEQVTKMDSLQISKEARNLSNISTDSVKEGNALKLESLKSQIKQGNYNPDSRMVAQRMMAIMNGSEV